MNWDFSIIQHISPLALPLRAGVLDKPGGQTSASTAKRRRTGGQLD